MTKNINIDIENIVHGRVIHYDAGDTITIFYRKELSGFGLRFGPILEHQSWSLRSFNSSVGPNTYAPNQRFKLDGKSLSLNSRGDETIEVIPHRSGHNLIIRAENPGQLYIDQTHHHSYLPPKWAYDYWFSTPWTRISEKNVLDEIHQANQYKLEPKIWLIDAGWQSNKELLTFNKELFPSEDNFLKNLSNMNIRPIVWFSPYVEINTDLWKLCDSNNWLVKAPDHTSAVFPVAGEGDIIGSYLDFTSTSFIEHLKARLEEMKTKGLAGIMFDFGESLPDEVHLNFQTDSSRTDRKNKITGHNWFVGETKKVMHQIMKPLDLCLISRSGWNDSYQHTGLWLGDQSSDSSRFAGLESVLWGYQTAHDAGYKFVGMDVGGYFGKPTITDYKRWLDLSVCMPFSMLHGAIKANPWEEGHEAIEYFKEIRKLHNKIWNNSEVVKIKFNRDNNKITKIIVNDYEFNN